MSGLTPAGAKRGRDVLSIATLSETRCLTDCHYCSWRLSLFVKWSPKDKVCT